LSALAPNLLVLRVSRLALGIFQAGLLPASTLILARWCPVWRRGFATAILNSFMIIGGALVAFLTGLLIEPLGWRPLLMLYAVPGLLWAAWFARWFRDQPHDHPAVNEAERALLEGESGTTERVATRAPVPWLLILLSGALWFICLQQACRAGVYRFFDLMLPTYLQDVRHKEISDANLWASVTLLAGVFGGPVGGSLSDWVLTRTGSRRLARQGVAIASIGVALGCYIVAFLIPNTSAAVLMASIGLFIMTFSSPCAFALTMDMGGRNLGVVFGLVNMTGNLGSWAFTKFLPRVVEHQGWDAALFVFAALHVVAILCWLPLNPNGVIGETAETTPQPKE
jgi:ACS family glucarate transporter-like MFS transporter